MSFEVNRGQADPRVKFLSRASGYTLFLTGTEAVLSLENRDRPPQKESHALPASRPSRPPTVMRMAILGANPASQAFGLDRQESRTNYFIGSDPKRWHTNVPSYSRVRYQDVYPGVDLVYYGSQRELEYDFVVRAGANPDVIKLSVTGTTKLEIDGSGDLLLHTKTGLLRQQRPRVYQPRGH